MREIIFYKPVPPVPVTSEALAKKVLVLVPDDQGGIRSLFQQMQNAKSVSATQTSITFFPSHDAHPGVMARFPQRLWKFYSTLRETQTQICHINLSIRGSTLRKIIFSMLCRRAQVPYVIHLHGSSYTEFFDNLPVWARPVVRQFFMFAARVIVLGEIWRDYVVNVIGVPRERVCVLPNAVTGPLSPIKRSQIDPANIVFLGRLGDRKGVPELLDALSSEEMFTQNWTAVIAGDGDIATYHERAQTLGLSDRVHFPGWVGADQVRMFLTKANILVLPSHAENLPLSLLEGMGYGLCPVVTPVGAVTDVIRHEKNGLLVPVGDKNALAAALIRVCADTELRSELAIQARADYLDNYDIGNYREKLEKIYLEVLDNPRTCV